MDNWLKKKLVDRTRESGYAQKKFYAFITRRINDYTLNICKIPGGLKLLQRTVVFIHSQFAVWGALRPCTSQAFEGQSVDVTPVRGKM